MPPSQTRLDAAGFIDAGGVSAFSHSLLDPPGFQKIKEPFA
jgi:hypothetical protein